MSYGVSRRKEEAPEPTLIKYGERDRYWLAGFVLFPDIPEETS
jgi:hypothetical protein